MNKGNELKRLPFDDWKHFARSSGRKNGRTRPSSRPSAEGTAKKPPRINVRGEKAGFSIALFWKEKDHGEGWEGSSFSDKNLCKEQVEVLTSERREDCWGAESIEEGRGEGGGLAEKGKRL